MKVSMNGKGRFAIDATRVEALLLKDALHEFQNYRSETEGWDSQCDPILVSQMVKQIDKVA